MQRFRSAAHSLSRRTLLTRAGVAAAAWPLGLIGARSAFADASAEAEPHYFLHLFFPGGMDASYTFDARPLAMTAAELIVNLLGEEPRAFHGKNGATTLRTRLVDPIMPFMDRFSVVNGMVMTPDFDGHEDNQSFLLTGNALGGDTYFETLAAQSGAPITAMTLGAPMVADSRMHTAGALRLTPSAARNVVDKATAQGTIDPDTPLMRFFDQRFALSADDRGSYAKTKLLMQHAAARMPTLASSLAGLVLPKLADPAAATLLDSVKMVTSAFKANLCNAAMCVFDTDLSQTQNLDVHDYKDNLELPRIIGELMTELAGIFKYLRDTPFDAENSLLDVTTVLVTTEFSRTMRQFDFAKSGTDHNALTSTALIGGKGVRGGLVLGASDMDSVASHAKGVSKAHLALDPGRIKLMGRPFDFAAQASAAPSVSPEAFDPAQYLTCASVVNTVLGHFGVPEAQWRPIGRNLPAARPLPALLVGHSARS
jgi:uncharacterized protein (DUF1501 family)